MVGIHRGTQETFCRVATGANGRSSRCQNREGRAQTPALKSAGIMPVRTKGKITSWNDEKGYGFISPLAGGNRTFIHIRAFANRSRRPAVGDIVTYSASTDSRGRPCAEQANIAGVPVSREPKRSSAALSYVMATGFMLVVVAAVLVSALPMPILSLYVVVSSTAFGAYALDKAAAEKGTWRTSESTLHLLALAGGWPGALIAQGSLRHKTRKQPFRSIFWATVVLNCAALAWLFTADGTKAWQSITAAVA
jgi:uncharacterized membrane protein YsdA (DUF1294 family)/cold shock CspA family protein